MTMPSSNTVAKGLEGVVAEATRLSDVQGQVGRLLYRGYDINDLASHSTFEETVYLLWEGSLPSRSQLDNFNKQLGAARPLSTGVLNEMQAWPKDAEPMDVLRTAVSALGLYDPKRADESDAARRAKALELTAQMATITAPTLVMTGDEDWPCLEPALLMKRKIPTAGLVVMPNAGHAINLEEPAAFNQHLSDFFHAVDAGAWRNRDPRAMKDTILGR